MTIKPCPPASTTPAFFRTGFRLTVFASASSPAAIALMKTSSSECCFFAAVVAASAARRETVRIVPSAGFMTALYAASTPSVRAAANPAASAVSIPFMRFEIPLKSRESITPEFPLAPLSIAEAVVFAASPTVCASLARRSFAAFPIVMPMFVPVSPSGTGKTLSSFIF